MAKQCLVWLALATATTAMEPSYGWSSRASPPAPLPTKEPIRDFVHGRPNPMGIGYPMGSGVGEGKVVTSRASVGSSSSSSPSYGIRQGQGQHRPINIRISKLTGNDGHSSSSSYGREISPQPHNVDRIGASSKYQINSKSSSSISASSNLGHHGATGIGPVGATKIGISNRQFGGHSIGGIGGHYGIGSGSVSKQISSSIGSATHQALHSGVGHHHLGGIGRSIGSSSISNTHQVNSVSSVGHHHGIGHHGSIEGITKTSQINSVSTVGHHHHHHHHGFGGLLGGLGGGWGHGLGHIGSLNVAGLGAHRLGIPSLSTIPGGYYGGLVAFPQAIPTSVSAHELHIPVSAVDTYKGYFGGYYPGSIGYGNSYRFFH